MQDSLCVYVNVLYSILSQVNPHSFLCRFSLTCVGQSTCIPMCVCVRARVFNVSGSRGCCPLAGQCLWHPQYINTLHKQVCKLSASHFSFSPSSFHFVFHPPSLLFITSLCQPRFLFFSLACQVGQSLVPSIWASAQNANRAILSSL